MLETAAIPSTSVPGGASSLVESFVGKYAAVQIYAGDILTAYKIRDTLVDPVAAGAAKGKQLVSLTLPNLTSSVSGAIQPGDVVSVMVTRKITQFNRSLGLLVATEQSTVTTSGDGGAGNTGESGEDNESNGTPTTSSSGVSQTLVSSIEKESETYIPEELRYLEVCKVTSSDGTDALVNATKDPDVPNRLPTTITFYVTEAQALKLAEIEQNGDIHIAFLARGDAADVFIPREERVLVEEPIATPTQEPVEMPAATPEETAEPGQTTGEPQTSTPTSATPEPAEAESPDATPEPSATPEPTAPIDPSEIDFNDPEVGE